MGSADHVAERFKRAQQNTLETLADQVADEFLAKLAELNLFSENNISQALAAIGLNAEKINSLFNSNKMAGPMVKALGGFVLRGLWYALIRPFLVLGKITKSPSFRQDIKSAFHRALKKDARDTKHMLDVASRWARGELVHPQEFYAAKKQLLRILVKVVLIYLAAPPIAGMFSGSLWKTLQGLLIPAEEILVLMLDRPLSAIAGRLLSTKV